MLDHEQSELGEPSVLVYQLIHKEVYKVPVSIVLDIGSEFTSHFWQALQWWFGY